MVNLDDYTVFMLAFGAIAFGLFLLIKGGDWTVDGAVFVADRAGLPKLFIGATIVAFGTSVPELFTSVNANISGFPGISVGNIVGSNIANVLLVLGVTAIVFPIVTKVEEVRRDMFIMLGATALMMGLLYTGSIVQWQGIVMFSLLVAYVVFQYVFAGGEGIEEPDEVEGISTSLGAAGYLLGGIALLALGSELLVNGAVAAGTVLGVPEAVIGLTVIAFGTSLPEVSTCLAAALKKQTNLIVGNILGSNLFNILSILGITAMISTIQLAPTAAEGTPEYAEQLQTFTKLTGLELWFLAAVSVGLVAWLLLVKRIGKGLGIAMVVAYISFTGYQYRDVFFGEDPAGLITVGGMDVVPETDPEATPDNGDAPPSPE